MISDILGGGPGGGLGGDLRQCHQITQGRGRGLTKVARDIFYHGLRNGGSNHANTFGVIIRLTNWDRNRSETHADTAMILCTTVKYEIIK